MTQNITQHDNNLRNLNDQDFKNLGLQEIAYVKMITVQNQKAYAIHAADGTPLTVMDDFNRALLLARQNDLEPFTVH